MVVCLELDVVAVPFAVQMDPFPTLPEAALINDVPLTVVLLYLYYIKSGVGIGAIVVTLFETALVLPPKTVAVKVTIVVIEFVDVNVNVTE